MPTLREPPTVSGVLDEPLRGILGPVEPVIERLFSFDRLRAVFDAARCSPETGGPIASLLAQLEITIDLDPAELRRIPPSGPIVAVANHPFGLLEGAILAHVLPRIRPDVRILANSMLAVIPELRDKCIFIDPFGRPDLAAANAGALRECLAWLRGGGAMVAFPAGEVAHWNWKDGILADPPWNCAAARLAQIAGAAALPMFFKGANSVLFQVAGALHPRLRTASLPRELLNKRGRSVHLRIGQPISHATLQSFPDAREATEYLRCRTYLLDSAPGRTSRAPVAPRIAPFGNLRRVAEAVPRHALAAEIGRLPAGRMLCAAGDLTVYLGKAEELPQVTREIGRLREIAFRRVGEGAGRTIDLDEFDRRYLHLFLWNPHAGEIAGAYRLGPTPDILPRYGIRGLYTSTLFRFRKELFDRIGPAIELGRSFIRPEYQKQYAPLLLLWKGIGRYVASRPECAALFGGVSISNSYHPVSRHLIVKFLEAHGADDLASMVAPRCAYRPSERLFRRTGAVHRTPAGIEDLSDLVAGLERDGKGVPILIKQYLKTGGRLLGFNVDRRFLNALDALILVDLRDLPLALLERYLGKAGAAAFSAWHAIGQGAA
ncbi:MAG: GNAT family N-acyltransferase [Bryobacteraceae bacterium]|jgi:putative hemolysin